MSLPMITAFRDLKLKPGVKLVALVLADCCNNKSGQCNPKVSTICERTGLCERTVQRILTKLDGVHLTITRNPGGKNSYLLHPGKPQGTPDNSVVDVTPAIMSPPPKDTPTPDICADTYIKEPERTVPPQLQQPEFSAFHLEAELPPVPKPKPQQEKATDPRHHAITSKIGAVHERVVGKPLYYPPRFNKVLQDFLLGWRGTPDEFLEMFADSLYFAGVNQYAKYTADACNPVNLCKSWNEVSAEVARFKKNEVTATTSKQVFAKTI